MWYRDISGGGRNGKPAAPAEQPSLTRARTTMTPPAVITVNGQKVHPKYNWDTDEFYLPGYVPEIHLKAAKEDERLYKAYLRRRSRRSPDDPSPEAPVRVHHARWSMEGE